MDAKDLKRFESKYTIEENGCWVWNKTGKNKYGMFWLKGKKRSAHRSSYEHYKETIDNGLFVLHTCDEPACVNPNHLFLGKHLDNMKDMLSKGRQAKGHRNHHCKLSEDEVLEVLNMEGSYEDIGHKFNVNRATVGYIKTGKLWSHITGITYHRKHLTKEELLEITKLIGIMKSIDIAERFGVSKQTISSIRTGNTWSHITGIKKEK